MRAHVTNRSRSARGLLLADGSTRFVEPGETALLDLADHDLHRAWDAAGDVSFVPVEAAPPRDRPSRRGRAG